MIARLLASLLANAPLALRLSRRELEARYRGSLLGGLWFLLTPILMVAIFTLVFSQVFVSRWPGVDDPKSFAFVLFAGLVVYQFFAELLVRAPNLFLEDRNYIRRLVFPVEILPVVALLTAGASALVSFAMLLLFHFALIGPVSPAALLLPLVLAPFVLLTFGLVYLLATLGVFLRDLKQITPWVAQALMFLGPIFYPIEALPAALRPYIHLNPMTFAIEETRKLLFFGSGPDVFGLWVYTLVAALVFAAGAGAYQALRPAFADVV